MDMLLEVVSYTLIPHLYTAAERSVLVGAAILTVPLSFCPAGQSIDQGLGDAAYVIKTDRRGEEQRKGTWLVRRADWEPNGKMRIAGVKLHSYRQGFRDMRNFSREPNVERNMRRWMREQLERYDLNSD
jgi:hypothetical protein